MIFRFITYLPRYRKVPNLRARCRTCGPKLVTVVGAATNQTQCYTQYFTHNPAFATLVKFVFVFVQIIPSTCFISVKCITELQVALWTECSNQ